MYLRAKKRIKDGKEHRYWSIVESCRNLDGCVVQRQVLYLGEINDSQKTAWCRTIEVLQVDSSAKLVLGLVILLYELQSRTGAGGSEKGSRRAMPVR